MTSTQKTADRSEYQRQKRSYLRSCKDKAKQFQKWVDNAKKDKKFVPPVLFLYLQGNELKFEGHPSLVGGFKQSIAVINEIVAAALTSEPSLELPKYDEKTPLLPPVRCDADINKSTFRERFIHEGVYAVNMEHLRSCIANMANGGIHIKNFWQDIGNRPTWWPKDIPFISPNKRPIQGEHLTPQDVINVGKALRVFLRGKDNLHGSNEHEIGVDEDNAEYEENQSAGKVESDTEPEKQESFKDEESAEDIEEDDVEGLHGDNEKEEPGTAEPTHFEKPDMASPNAGCREGVEKLAAECKNILGKLAHCRAWQSFEETAAFHDRQDDILACLTAMKHGLQATVSSIPRRPTTRSEPKNGARKSALLPELPRASSVAAPKCSSASANPTRTTLELPATKRKHHKGTKGAVSKSKSDIVVAKLNALSLSSTTKKRSAQKSEGRHFSTFNVSSVDDIANLIKYDKCKNIIVMAGAGISTPSGIPDFRTPGTGLYDNLADYNLPDPTSVFDLHFFNYDPKPFFRLAKELYPGNFPPNFVHYFVRVLHEKKLLLRMYTQNIDALERAAGIPESKLVEAHGSFAKATCRKCKANYDGKEILDDVMNQNVPKCRKDGCKGVIKPNIVFFHEDLPKKFFEYPKDFAKCDLLIVLGTSLGVYPFAGLVEEVSISTPRLLINRETVGPFKKKIRRSNDAVIKGDIVEGVEKLVKALRWTESIREIMKRECTKESSRDTEDTAMKDTQLDAAVKATKLDNEPKEIKLPVIDK